MITQEGDIDLLNEMVIKALKENVSIKDLIKYIYESGKAQGYLEGYKKCKEQSNNLDVTHLRDYLKTRKN